MSERPPRFFVYHLSRLVFGVFFKIWLRWTARGVENIPATGGCLIAANHASFLDPPMIACAVKCRQVKFLARDTLFRFPPVGWWLHIIGVIPLSRDRGDVAALRKSIQLLKDGICLGVFPEGTRTSDGELQPAKGGIGFLIAKAGVPVIPAYISGSYKAYPRGARWVRAAKCSVVFGPPVMPEELLALGSERDSYDKIGQLVMDRIRSLKAGPA